MKSHSIVKKKFFHPTHIRMRMNQNQQLKRVSLEYFHYIIADESELEYLNLLINESD